MAMTFSDETGLRQALLEAGGAFITGTDTEVGKTVVSAALLRWLNDGGLCAVGYKPIASGAERTADGLRNEDGLALQAASCGEPAYEQINPVCFEPAIAPHLATPEVIDAQLLVDGYQRLRERYELVLVEGAGGWKVPLSERFDIEDLALAIGLPVVLVVGLRLGCINHARLSVQAMLASGVPVLGWVGNAVDPQMVCREENIDTLRRLMPVPELAQLGHLPR